MSWKLFQATAILFREGLEALLVITALAAYLTKAGERQRVAALYWGAGFAVAATICVASTLGSLYAGVRHSLAEAALLLGTAVLMLYLSGWLFRPPRVPWHRLLKSGTEEALSGGAQYAVGALGFLVVFREGTETVLFLYAVAGTGIASPIDIASSLAIAAISLAAVMIVAGRLAGRLPLRLAFLLTSALLFGMAIKLTGAAVEILQEHGYISRTLVAGDAWLARTGFHPSWEAIALQLAIVALSLANLVMYARRNRAAAIITDRA